MTRTIPTPFLVTLSTMHQEVYSGTVLHGDKMGRTLGFPSANLEPALLKHVKKEGVYACQVHVNKKSYRGALYLGPRLVMDETKRVLEIHIVDFNGDIYGETLQFKLGAFIRPPLDFTSEAELIAQLQEDIAAVRKSPQL